MSEYAGKFDRVFLERTKHIIENVKTEYEFTLLLNCTLALICQPIEKLNNNIIENFKRGEKHKENYEIVDLIAEIVKKYSKNLTGNNLQILRCLRNGIAHINISPINLDGNLDRITIKGTTIKNDVLIENIFIYTQSDLKKLSLEILDVYLGYAN